MEKKRDTEYARSVRALSKRREWRWPHSRSRICESFARKVLATRFMCILLVPRGGSNPCPRAHIEFPIVERMDVKRYSEIEGAEKCGLL